MRPTYEPFAGETEILARIGQLTARTVIFDVEPLVAFWNGSQD